ncbi:hypothetical protein PIB30_008988 [Stylosanthes scabra]|uniref:Uncharacterized protein n=1 Tax=Stylosanthes scabra TaxID=79078 RepID=A0ABU6S4W0_9FABA|nr:hypothetical protein [Stylosanthes scabra]
MHARGTTSKQLIYFTRITCHNPTSTISPSPLFIVLGSANLNPWRHEFCLIQNIKLNLWQGATDPVQFQATIAESMTRCHRLRMTCENPYYDGSVVLGYLSTAFLIASTIAGLTAGVAAAMLLWPTITEQFQLKESRRVHSDDVNYACPTAKTGVLGGGALLSLDSSLFWLIALILADNAREDFLAEQEDKGDPTLIKLE